MLVNLSRLEFRLGTSSLSPSSLPYIWGIFQIVLPWAPSERGFWQQQEAQFSFEGYQEEIQGDVLCGEG